MWLIYALICAFSLATADVFSKKALAGENVALVAWVRIGYATPFLVLLLPFIDIPSLDITFWKATIVLLPCDMIALLLYMKAIKTSPLSLTLPFLALTPLFLLGTSWVILGEFPDISGLIGILLIVIGAYALNAHSWRHGFFEPFKAITREPGSLLMIIVAFIFSFSSNFGKLAVLHSSPAFFGSFYNILLALVMLPLLWLQAGSARAGSNCGPGVKRRCPGRFGAVFSSVENTGPWRGIFNQPKVFLAIGFFTALMVFTHFLALELTLVSYMISVKRTSLLFGVLYGGLVFKEQNIRERFLGSLLMVLGVVLIIL